MSNSSCRFKSGPRYQRQLQVIIVHFGRFFYAKKTARRKALPRLYSLSGKLFPFCGLYSPFPPPFIPAFSRNMKLVKPPPSAPMGAAEDMSAASRNAISIPSSAPIAAEAATTAANAVTMMKRGPIFMTLTSFREVLYS